MADYGSARITEGGAPVLLQRPGTRLRGAELRVSCTGPAQQAGLHHPHRSRTDARNRSLDREWTVIQDVGL